MFKSSQSQSKTHTAGLPEWTKGGDLRSSDRQDRTGSNPVTSNPKQNIGLTNM